MLAAAAAAASRRLRGPAAAAIASQIVRAALSVPANIAEGYGRGVSKDGARFLRVARGSAAELESHVRVAVMAAYLGPSDAEPLIRQARFVRFLTKRLLESVLARTP